MSRVQRSPPQKRKIIHDETEEPSPKRLCIEDQEPQTDFVPIFIPALVYAETQQNDESSHTAV